MFMAIANYAQSENSDQIFQEDPGQSIYWRGAWSSVATPSCLPNIFHIIK